MVKEIKISPIDDNDTEDMSVRELNASNRALIAKVQELINIQTTQHELQKQMDWKLWVIMNALCDGFLKKGAIINDPRHPVR